MDSQTSPIESTPTPTLTLNTSCRKNKDENATFVADLKDHFNEFITRSMDEHKACFISKVHKISEKLDKFAPSKKDEDTASLSATVKN